MAADAVSECEDSRRSSCVRTPTTAKNNRNSLNAQRLLPARSALNPCFLKTRVFNLKIKSSAVQKKNLRVTPTRLLLPGTRRN